MSTVQRHISTRRLFTNRISGLTYEPNWFAGQISFLLLPWLLGSVLSGFTVFRWRWHFLTVEWFMLGWAIAVIPFTYSRAGLIILLGLILISVFFFRGRERRKLTEPRSVARIALRRGLEGLIILIVMAVGIYFAGSKNVFFARLWDYWQRRPDQGYLQYMVDYLEYLGFGARFAYWQTAYRVFEEYPVLGVGLGNYAFYFDDKLPDRPLAIMPEVLRLIVPEEDRTRLITSKNLYLRLMAETGFVGMAAFLAFVVAILGCALYLWFSPGEEARFWGVAGLLGIIGFALVAFSFDSFAVPNMWVVFGFITAAARLSGGHLAASSLEA